MCKDLLIVRLCKLRPSIDRKTIAEVVDALEQILPDSLFRAISTGNFQRLAPGSAFEIDFSSQPEIGAPSRILSEPSEGGEESKPLKRKKKRKWWFIPIDDTGPEARL